MNGMRPETINELRQWAESHNLPLQQMRTHIGEDRSGPKCFGIYQDMYTGEFVVYKNKADGTRAVRYKGHDEARAVNELYEKMKERVAVQKSARAGYGPAPRQRRENRFVKAAYSVLIVSCMVPVLMSFIALGFRMANRYRRGQLPYAQTGYYYIDDQVYYHRGSGYWYSYDSYTWHDYIPDASWELFDDYLDYYEGYDEAYDQEYGFDGWYEEYSASQDSGWDDDDDDYDWDDGWDWDDSYDDWDSDW